MTTYSFLEPFTLKNGVILKNRVVMAPMTTKSSYFNGATTGDEIAYFAMRSGGVGMVITGAVSVNPLGQGFEGGPAIYNDSHLPQLKKLAASIKVGGTKAVMQIFHAGRKSTTAILRGELPVSASAVAAEWPPNSETPRELTSEEVQAIVEDFGQATRRAIEAGFDGIEIHGANTYLIQQFFSPHSNRRQDKWGGNREERMTFAKTILAKVRDVIAQYADDNFILGYRISPEELETPGIRLEDSLYFVQQIQNEIDYLHLSIGSYNRTSLNNKDDQTPLITHFKNVLDKDIPLITVGTIKTPEQALEAMELGADFVAMGRALINEPRWVQKVEVGMPETIRLRLNPLDMDDLAIPAGMQDYLLTTYKNAIDFTTNEAQEQFDKGMAPMEGYKKQ